jgi:hypothetical protein
MNLQRLILQKVKLMISALPNNVLLLTNHLYEFAGSEMIVIELLEALSAKGTSVTVFANDMDRKFADVIVQLGGKIVDDATKIRLSEFDLIYSQHSVITLFLDQLLELDDLDRPAMVYAHLSPYHPLEFPGPIIEPNFADVIVHNSAETGAVLCGLGLDLNRLLLMPNPAPDAYFEVPNRNATLQRILVVSNHVPKELSKALKRLEKNGISVTYRGIESRNARVSPSDLADHDAVVSIGKTVQYALAAGRPCYVYDRFGGPGYLTPKNLESSSWHNFSGRCCHRKLLPDQLASEIQAGFSGAKADRNELRLIAEKFRLSSWLEESLFPTVAAAKASRKNDPRELDGVKAMRRELSMYKFSIENIRTNRRVQLVDSVIPNIMKESVFAYRILYFLSRIGPKESRRGFRIFYSAMKRNRLGRN